MVGEPENQSSLSRPGSTKMPKGKRPALTRATGIHIHPYTVAVSLGKQIRFSAPLEQIAAELEAVTQGKILSVKVPSDP